MTCVLSLDLGITTGWCVRDVLGHDLIATGTVKYLDDDGLFEKDLLSLVQRYLPSHVVIESPVITARGELNGKLSALITVSKKVFRTNTEQVTPTQWKQRYASTKIPIKGITRHEMDAYRILEWWLQVRAPLL